MVHLAGARMGLWNREPLRGGVRMAMGTSTGIRTGNRARSEPRSVAGEGTTAHREAGLARRVDRDLRPRNPKSNRRGQEPGAADARVSDLARERRIRESR